MGQIVVKGSAAQTNLEKLMPIDLDDLSVNQLAYTFLTTENGTILDDLIVTRLEHDTFHWLLMEPVSIKTLRICKLIYQMLNLPCWRVMACWPCRDPAAEVLANLAPTSNSLRFIREPRL